jgi:flagellar hook-associated protein FlgK
MTIEERFERIEHVTAGLAEEHRREREENRQLWRDTQRQINELTVRMNDLTLKVADTNDAIIRFAEESRAADRQLGDRIDALVSAIGKFPFQVNGRAMIESSPEEV